MLAPMFLQEPRNCAQVNVRQARVAEQVLHERFG